MKGSDFIVYLGMVVFMAATVLGTAELFRSPWPALALVGLWVIMIGVVVADYEDMKKGR